MSMRECLERACPFTCFFIYVHDLNRATLVSELVDRGEKMLRDGLGSPSSNPSKLNDSICAQLCDSGLDALERATRYNGVFYMYPAVPPRSRDVISC